MCVLILVPAASTTSIALPAAMPTVWVSAQCVVEADEVRISWSAAIALLHAGLQRTIEACLACTACIFWRKPNVVCCPFYGREKRSKILGMGVFSDIFDCTSFYTACPFTLLSVQLDDDVVLERDIVTCRIQVIYSFMTSRVLVVVLNLLHSYYVCNEMPECIKWSAASSQFFLHLAAAPCQQPWGARCRWVEENS